MRHIWLAALIVVPLASGLTAVQQFVGIDSNSQGPFAPLSSGDKGTATVGASQTAATVTVDDLSIQVADDILDITSADAAWQVHARYVGHTGFAGLLTTFTLSLRDGTSSVDQVRIANGVAVVTSGAPVDLPATRDTELFASASLAAAGSVQIELLLSRDDGMGPMIHYPVTVTVV